MKAYLKSRIRRRKSHSELPWEDASDDVVDPAAPVRAVTEAEVTKFTYPPLPDFNHIRLCTLLAGSAGDPIECRLKANPLSSETGRSYEAVSYAWGSSADEVEILCNGARMKIRPNLLAGLHQLRFETRDRVLWIDRLCIDQQNDEEKSYQVAMMDKIFSQASQVLLWLGDPPAGQDLPLDLMHLIVEKVFVPIYIKGDRREGLKILSLSNKELQRDFQIPPPESNEWKSIRDFLRNTWFQRTWTFQEFMVARSAEIRYGNKAIQCDDTNSSKTATYTLSFQAFMYALHELENRRVTDAVSAPFGLGSSQTHPFLLIDGRHKRRDNSFPYSRKLLTLLRRRRRCEATDPRDKVYALLNVASDKERIAMFPDYAATREETYIRVARAIIKSDETLELLHCVGADRLDRDLPSWVPDWTHFPTDRSEMSYNSRRTYYRSTGNSKALVGGLHDMSKLMLRGIHFDDIQGVGSKAEKHRTKALSEYVVNGGEWSLMAERLSVAGVYKPTGEPVGHAFARTRLLDMRYLTRIGSVPGEIEELKSQDLGQNKRTLLERRGVDEEVRYATSQRRFFVTSKGYMGIGSEILKKHDVVFLLLGSDSPFILRRVPESSTFKLVGKCYIHGIMDGEALIDHRAKFDSTYDKTERTWLDGLDEGSLPFPTEDVVLF